MFKKISLLALASIMAVSSVASAAPNKKKLKVTNESSVGYYYKVGGKTIYIAPGSSKSFPIPKNKKNISIKTSLTENGGFNTVATVTRSEAKAEAAVQVNPSTGQSTDISK